MVKLVIEEPERPALRRYLKSSPTLVSSRIALVEVTRAVSIGRPADAEAQGEARRLLESCELLAVSDSLLLGAASLASLRVRTLDAIHLASALRIEADEMISYDRCLTAAAAAEGLATASPGAVGDDDREG